MVSTISSFWKIEGLGVFSTIWNESSSDRILAYSPCGHSDLSFATSVFGRGDSGNFSSVSGIFTCRVCQVEFLRVIGVFSNGI